MQHAIPPSTASSPVILPHQHCRLLHPVRDHEGRERLDDQGEILRVIDDRESPLYFVRFRDGATMFVFQHEIAIVDWEMQQGKLA